MGYGSGVTCWRRLRDWQEQGVWQQLHEVLLARLNATGEIAQGRSRLLPRTCLWGGRAHRPELSRPKAGFQAPSDHLRTRQPPGGPDNRRKRQRITRFVSLVDAVPAVRGQRGRPRRRPTSVYGDRAYHSRKSRRELRRRRVKVRVARQSDPHGSGLGRKRWVVDAPSPGFTSTAVCGSAMSAAPTSTRRSDNRLLPDLPQAASSGGVI